jgi:hypothetical protein
MHQCTLRRSENAIFGTTLICAPATIQIAFCEQTMEKHMLEDVKELFQSFIAPQLQGIKGDIRALDTKIDTHIAALNLKIDVKIDALDAKISAQNAEIDALEMKFDSKAAALEAKFDSKIDALDSKIGAVDIKLETYRRELVAEMRSIDQAVLRVEKTLSTDFIRLEQKVDLRLLSMDERLDSFRREMLAEIKAASK